MKLLLILLLPLAAAARETVSVAAAANLAFVLQPLDAAFAAAHPEFDVSPTIGASGSLVVMIRHGAPYDVFLSADMEYPKKLIAAHGAQADSLVAFAYGKLVLWTTRPGRTIMSIADTVRDPAVQKIAMANPKTAPYGVAAEQALARLHLTDAAAGKLVFGENISQTAQFVSSGNADAGFVALSLVLAPNLKQKGSWREVPADLYAPLEQGAVLTTRGAKRPAARAFLEFLKSPEAQRLLRQFGYGIAPPSRSGSNRT